MTEAFDIKLDDWTKRRIAMIKLLTNPRMPDYTIDSLLWRANALAMECELNGHPVCAEKIRAVLRGDRFIDLSQEKVPNIEKIRCLFDE